MAPVPLVVSGCGAIVSGPPVAVTVTVFDPFAVKLASCVTVLVPVRLRFPPVEATGPPIVKSFAMTANSRIRLTHSLSAHWHLST